MVLSKTKNICVISLLITYYMMASFLPLDIPFFSTKALILGLMYPFLKKSQRIIVTIIYQTYFMFNVGTILQPIAPSMYNILVYNPEPQASQIIKSIPPETINYITLFFTVNPVLVKVLVVINSVLVAVVAGIILSDIIVLIVMFTQPHSVYWVYQKIGLYKMIEKRTGGRIVGLE